MKIIDKRICDGHNLICQSYFYSFSYIFMYSVLTLLHSSCVIVKFPLFFHPFSMSLLQQTAHHIHAPMVIIVSHHNYVSQQTDSFFLLSQATLLHAANVDSAAKKRLRCVFSPIAFASLTESQIFLFTISFATVEFSKIKRKHVKASVVL